MSMLDPVISSIRERISAAGEGGPAPERETLLAEIAGRVRAAYELRHSGMRSLVRVINATGIVIHTNLGRAPLGTPRDGGRRTGGTTQAEGAGVDNGRQLVATGPDGDGVAADGCGPGSWREKDPCEGYSNLEFNLVDATRGRRDAHFTGLIGWLTGAEDAIVVNNNAAALLLISHALAKGSEIVVARGEAVEIGEGFRILEMLSAGGARIRETGATNAVTADDYACAISPDTAMIAKIHTSNYRVEGFTRGAAPGEISAICRRYGIISYHDCGSGLIDRSLFNKTAMLADEPEVREAIAEGYDLVSFSGDKLFGSVQCGIICGRAEIVRKLRKCQLYRALRVSKSVVAALSRTLEEYLAGDPAANIPVIRMLNESDAEIEKKTKEFIAAVEKSGVIARLASAGVGVRIDIERKRSAAGGGSTPGGFIENPVATIFMHDGRKNRNDAATEAVSAIRCADAGTVSAEPAGAKGGSEASTGGEGAGSRARGSLAILASLMRGGTPAVVGYVDSDRFILNFRTVARDETQAVAAAFVSALEKLAEA